MGGTNQSKAKQPRLGDDRQSFIEVYGGPIDGTAVDNQKHAVLTFIYAWSDARIDTRPQVTFDTNGKSAIIGLYYSDAPPTQFPPPLPSPEEVKSELHKFLPSVTGVKHVYVPRPTGGVLLNENGEL